MPKQKRWAIKRSLSQAEQAVAKSQVYLVETGRLYEIEHPDYYQHFCAIVIALENIKSAITRLNEQI